ncbi:hypothetical protein PFICI_09689 [Pestalotiopsis fici W106-1]|uniref:NADP-dependent oxidoreductase domain-containing protein n=1 Tax=Pestalotiopsis fici (strain W106-1 / CGMCC3.15140) TaxID=1229662 RepID=W3WWX0_PESFW|nr:uncharacterized protein PFICI_09689 [Pestalotiopsis fici W106-1]ETS77627.1 hypothetical protein PFICI_09689 [Pestalotiopsis fici W106-1]
MAAHLKSRKVGKYGPNIAAIGFGLMSLGGAHGQVDPSKDKLAVLDRAWELGATNWDTADVYGNNELMVGDWFRIHPERRSDIFLASKFGLIPRMENDGRLVFDVDSSPEYCRKACEQSLSRLGVDSIDLFYIHRVDGKTPIENTIKEMVNLKSEGKFKYFGISECSSDTLRRASDVHHITTIQVEYNPWALEVKGPSGTFLLQAARKLGTAVFCYSPLGRGILTGRYKSADDLEPTDFRRSLPRFQNENFSKNLEIVERFKAMADEKGCSTGQLVLAWILAQGKDMFPIPGTKNLKYLEENVGSLSINLSQEDNVALRQIIEEADIAGDRGPGPSAYADTPLL